MAAMDRMIRKAFIQYAKKHYPGEAENIIRKADELFPVMYAKAPDIGGRENALAYNLDMMILAVSFYEASEHRIDGDAVREIAAGLYRRLCWIRGIVNINRRWQMKLMQSVLYRRYIPYAKLVEEKTANGEWGNTWHIRINPRNTQEGLCFDLVGCPLADYARANGYEHLLPSMCASDHLLASLIHAKLIRTHTCATGSDSCDYWYVGDRSAEANVYADVQML